MRKRMKILIGYDGSSYADAAVDDLRRAGLPSEVEALVVSVGDAPIVPPFASHEVIEKAFVGERVVSIVDHANRHVSEVLKQANELVLSASLQTDPLPTLLEFGADVNAQAEDGFTPLILAACSGDPGITQALLNSGADVRKTSRSGETAISHAAEHGYSDIVELLKGATSQSTQGKPERLPSNIGRVGIGKMRGVGGPSVTRIRPMDISPITGLRFMRRATLRDSIRSWLWTCGSTLSCSITNRRSGQNISRHSFPT